MRKAAHDDSRYHLQGSSVWVVATEPQARQVDGDVMEQGRSIQARVRTGALRVRVPRTAASD